VDGQETVPRRRVGNLESGLGTDRSTALSGIDGDRGDAPHPFVSGGTGNSPGRGPGATGVRGGDELGRARARLGIPRWKLTLGTV